VSTHQQPSSTAQTAAHKPAQQATVPLRKKIIEERVVLIPSSRMDASTKPCPASSRCCRRLLPQRCDEAYFTAVLKSNDEQQLQISSSLFNSSPKPKPWPPQSPLPPANEATPSQAEHTSVTAVIDKPTVQEELSQGALNRRRTVVPFRRSPPANRRSPSITTISGHTIKPYVLLVSLRISQPA
jgi:hypothetical protein